VCAVVVCVACLLHEVICLFSDEGHSISKRLVSDLQFIAYLLGDGKKICNDAVIACKQNVQGLADAMGADVNEMQLFCNAVVPWLEGHGILGSILNLL